MRKRVISILLVALMVVSLLPTVALATETAGLDNFKKVQTYTDGKFTDVKADDWFEKNVSSAYELNLMVGRRNDFFDTDNYLTVAEAMTIAARLRSIYYTGKAEFEQGDPWYQAYTDYCKANGVADPADYDMNKAITRGEFAEIFAKALPADALKKINTVQDNMIPDVKKTDKFSAAIYLLYRAGVLVGNDKKGTFAPDTNIKRVEVAAITTRMAQPALRESIRLVKPSSGGGSYTPPAPTTYTVTFDMQEHGTQIDPITNVASNAKITAPTAPTADGYAFKGWYKTLDATTGTLSDEWNFDSDTVTADITLYAKWVEAKTLDELLPDDFPDEYEKGWENDTTSTIKMFYVNGQGLLLGSADPGEQVMSDSAKAEKVSGGYQYVNGDTTIIFSFDNEGALTSIQYSNPSGEQNNGTYTAPTAPTYTVTFDEVSGGAVYDAATSGNEVKSISVASGSAVSVDGNKITIGGKDYYARDNWDYYIEYKFKEFSGEIPDKITKETTITPVFDVASMRFDWFMYGREFPDNEKDAWVNGNGGRMYLNNRELIAKWDGPDADTLRAVIASDRVKKVEGGWEFVFDLVPPYYTVFFEMDNDSLVSITLTNYNTAGNGTYTAPSN